MEFSRVSVVTAFFIISACGGESRPADAPAAAPLNGFAPSVTATSAAPASALPAPQPASSASASTSSAVTAQPAVAAPFVIRIVVTDGKGGETNAFTTQLRLETSDGQKLTAHRRLGHTSFSTVTDSPQLPLTIAPGAAFPALSTSGYGGSVDMLRFSRPH